MVDKNEKWITSSDPEQRLRKAPELLNELRALFRHISDGSGPAEIMGDYRILRKIGSGGMGTVYEAEQISLKRRVALKVLNPHLSRSSRALRKFFREAQASGRQHHPGIVSIHVMGEQSGVHYIAEELVEGSRTLAERLNRYRKAEVLPPDYFRKTAQLMNEVAEALEHVHSTDVIHRDIKPSNILITREGRAKVTDFGLAHVKDALYQSRTGEFSGTPYYMSPEQTQTRKKSIDHRTDIYSFGVTLYECLVRKRPFEGDDSHEVLKKVLSREPADPCREDPRVPRDLAVICLKAMEKNPGDRYATMGELRSDLGRYLRSEAILARPTRPMVKIWRRIKRNPTLYASVSLAVLATLAVLWAYPQLMEARDKALAAEKQAVEEVEKNSAINAFLQEIFTHTQPDLQGGENRLAENMVEAAEKVEKDFKGKLGIGIAIQNTVGLALRRLGRPDEAEPYLRDVLEYREAELGDEDLFTNVSRNNLAVVLSDLGRLKEAEVLYRKVVDNHGRVLGEEHLNTCTVMNNLAELLDEKGKLGEAESRYRRLLEIDRRTLGEEHEETLRVMGNLAANLLRQCKLAEAEALILRTGALRKEVLGETHRDTLGTYVLQGTLLARQYRFAEAEAVLRNVSEQLGKYLGLEHPRTMSARNCLAAVLKKTGELEEAESICREVLKVRADRLGMETPVTLLTTCQMAGILLARGKVGEAEDYAKQALEAQHRVLGNDHPDTLLMMDCLASILVERGALVEAIFLYEQLLKTAEVVLPPEHQDQAWFRIHYGECLIMLGRFEKAEPQLVAGYESLKAASGETNPRMSEPLTLLIKLYKALQKSEKVSLYSSKLLAIE